MTEHKATMSSANGPVPQKKLRDGGARLLALDGGGVKGVSALIILGDIMRRVKDLEVKTGSTTKKSARLLTTSISQLEQAPEALLP